MALVDDAEDLIIQARAYADSAYEEAVDLVANAQKAASGGDAVGAPFWNHNVDTNILKTAEDAAGTNQPPAFNDQYVAPSSAGISIPDLASIYIPEVPTFPDAPAPLDTTNLFQQEAPAYDVPQFAETSPNVSTDIELPDKPEIVFPDTPEYDASSFDVPDVAVPVFDAVMEGKTPGSIQSVDDNYKALYASALPEMRAAMDTYADSFITRFNPEYHNQIASIESKITTDLEGGHAVSDAFEQRLFNRARDRAEGERRRLSAEVTDSMAKRGYVLPSGSVAAGLSQSQQLATEVIATATSEVAIERQRIELQHYQFILSLSLQLRQMVTSGVIQYMGELLQVNSQALEHAKNFAEIQVDIYNAELKLFEAEARVFRTRADVYTIQLEAAFAELKKFDAEMKAIQVQTDIEKSEIDKYKTLIQAEGQKIDLYLAELRGVATQADLRKLAVDIYGEQVRAYLGQVQAKEAEYSAFESSLRGDEAKVRSYTAQVEAYRAEVGAVGQKVDAQRTQVQSGTEYNKALIDVFQAEVQKYRTELEAEGKRFSSSVDANKAAIARYQSVLSGQLEMAKVKLGLEELEWKTEQEQYRGVITADTADARTTIAEMELKSTAAAQGARVLGNLATAAVGAQNSMITIAAENT